MVAKSPQVRPSRDQKNSTVWPVLKWEGCRFGHSVQCDQQLYESLNSLHNFQSTQQKGHLAAWT